MFSFAVDAGAPGLYRLAIGLVGQACGRVFWRGPADGLAAAGGSPVEIEGFAARTQVEILADASRRDPDVTSPTWVGADAFDLAVPASGIRTLRWRSSLPAVQSGELQIAATPFPTRGRIDACAEPAEGLLLRRAVDGRGKKWTTLAPVDVWSLVAPGRPGTDGTPDDAVDGRVGRSRAAALRAGAPLYIRVVPIVNGERRCDVREHGLPGWAMVAHMPSETPVLPPIAPPPSILTADLQTYQPPFVGGPLKARPTYGERGFTVVKDHTLPPIECYGGSWSGLVYLATDPLGCEILAANWLPPGGTVTKGTSFILGPPASSGGGGGGFLSFFTDTLPALATGLIDAIGMGINFFAGLVDDVKAALADVVLSVLKSLPGVKNACDGLGSSGLADCETLVKGAMEAGMVAMGLPPSLPDWEALKDQGVEYLAAQIASEVGGGPLAQSLTEELITQVAQETLEAISAKKSAGTGAYGWVQPYLFFDPAVWTTSVSWTGIGTLPSSLVLRRYASSLYVANDLPLPTTTLPGISTLRIPMVLQPRLQGIPAPVCRTDRFRAVTCTPWFGTHPRCYSELWQWSGNGGSGAWTWVEFDCQYTDYVAIYYRDQWVSQRYDATPCVNLAASTFQDVSGLLLTAPQPPFFNLARLESADPRFWVGALLLSPGCP